MLMAGPGSLNPFKTIVARKFFLVTYPKGEFLRENDGIFAKNGGISEEVGPNSQGNCPESAGNPPLFLADGETYSINARKLL